MMRLGAAPVVMLLPLPADAATQYCLPVARTDTGVRATAAAVGTCTAASSRCVGGRCAADWGEHDDEV
jgi:hypothetical protein